jgi:O-antigen/teichoic acid export membrane protein
MRKNTAWAFAGNSVYAGCQWVVFVLLVKMLSAEHAGTFAYAAAITGPVFVLTNVRLRNLLATSVETNGGFTDYVTARVFTTMAGIVISIGAAMVMSPAAGSLAVVGVMALGRACDALSDICHGLFQREFDMRSAAIGLSMNGFASVVFVACSLMAWRSILAATAAYAGGSLVALSVWDVPRTLRRQPADESSSRTHRTRRGSIGSAVRLITIALPLGISSAVGSVQTNIPRFVIAFALGAASLAKFAAISYITLIGHLVVNATSQAALPILAKDVRVSDPVYRTRLTFLVCGTIVAGAVTLLVTFMYGDVVLAFIYGREYASDARVLFWLAAGTVVTFASVFLGTGTTARQRFKSQLAISLVTLAVVGACTAPFVRRFGLIGAAWALCLGAAVEFSAYALLTIRDLKYPALVVPEVAPTPVAEGIAP